MAGVVDQATMQRWTTVLTQQAMVEELIRLVAIGKLSYGFELMKITMMPAGVPHNVETLSQLVDAVYIQMTTLEPSCGEVANTLKAYCRSQFAPQSQQVALKQKPISVYVRVAPDHKPDAIPFEITRASQDFLDNFPDPSKMPETISLNANIAGVCLVRAYWTTKEFEDQFAKASICLAASDPYASFYHLGGEIRESLRFLANTIKLIGQHNESMFHDWVKEYRRFIIRFHGKRFRRVKKNGGKCTASLDSVIPMWIQRDHENLLEESDSESSSDAEKEKGKKKETKKETPPAGGAGGYKGKPKGRQGRYGNKRPRSW